ncbi:MAG: peptidoglycan DD-metalloendopeptidase family protein [Candidatus Latescibacterota bacterium]|nr:MAG: peptidoglycan DD-metalloendopeptidase family protein [Candidatus Latescibacterota bacterium]
MKRALIFLIVLTVCGAGAKSDPPESGFYGFRLERNGPCISERQRREIRETVREERNRFEAQGLLRLSDQDAVIKFVWPVKAADWVTDPGFYGVSGFPDHDTLYPNHLLDYDCGARTYDLDIGYNHTGTDIFNWPFLWNKMDHDEVEVIAACEGVIVYRLDGYFDRSCGLGGGNANVLVLLHDNGSVSVYGHMKRGSLTRKTEGDTLAAGEYIGIVGSSGWSTGPHLHFEVWDSDDNMIDPWEGACNNTITESWWAVQKPYFDPAINKISTHAAPVDWQDCPYQDITHISDVFVQGDVVYFYTFGKDGLRFDTYDYAIYRPDGSVFDAWTYEFQAANYAAAYAIFWGKQIPIDEQVGKWKYEVVLRGQVYEHDFYVGGVPVFFNTVDAVVGRVFVELTWDVLSDEPLDGFAIYRKEDGASCEVPVVGELLSPQTRRYVDPDVRAGASYSYVVSAVERDGGEVRSAPVYVSLGSYSIELVQNYPNPFNPTTTIEYTMPQRSVVDLSIYDPQGRLIVTLERGTHDGGAHRATWDGRDARGAVVSSGVYFYRLTIDGRVLTKKMIFLK